MQDRSNQNSKAKLLEKLNNLLSQVHMLDSPEKVFQYIKNVSYYVFDNLDDGFFEVDLKGRYIFANRTICQYYGKALKELIGISALEVMPCDYRRKIILFFNKLYKENNSAKLSDIKLYNSNGKSMHIDLYVAVTNDKMGSPIGFQGIAINRTLAMHEQLEIDQYRKFVENANDGFFETDLNGKFTFINQAMCCLHGSCQSELIGRNYLDFLPRNKNKSILKIFKQLYVSDAPARIFDYTITDNDGQLRNLEVLVQLVRNREGTPIGFRGITRDRTEKIVQDRELMRYQEFVESIDDGCFETDLKGNFTFANKAMCELHECSMEEFIGMNHHEFVTPKDHKNLYEVFNLIYKTGIPSRVFDYSITTKSGKSHNLEVSAKLICDQNGKGIGFRGITRDRTEKKIQELELERYRKFLENVEDACFEVDLQGNFIFFNDATCQIFGYPAEELMGMNNRDYTSPETSKKIYHIFNKIYKSGRPADVFDYEIRRGDGQIRYLDMSASLICDDNGTPIGFRGICRDVTDQKNAQKENERLSELLNEAQRLEAITTLAAGVAHNFNNLLMSIQGYVSLLSMGLESDHPNFQRLKAIENHINKGSELTLQLLSYANVTYNPAHKVNINEIIKNALSVYKMTHKQIYIFEQYSEAIHDVTVDRKQMEHVLMNLFKNAVQAMPSGGKLYLETENVVLGEAFVKAYGRNPGTYVKVSIRDTGIGMDKPTQERIFEPFFTTQNLGMATGLGLAAVYGVIKKHKGIIDVKSEKNQGTTFTIYLPSKAELPKHNQFQGHPRITENQKVILIVDDEEVFIKVLSRMLERMGYSILSASNSHEALETFRENKDRIKLVIMDMVMPGISGDQLIEMFQNLDPEVNVILVSGYIKDEKMKKISTQNRRAFLQKPFQHETLQETIESLIALESK
ncbi:MAG: PAS domain S-box protein [Desulfobacteraceae bacterium]|jgi:PAS domain S-box-containing protein